jgi:predicted glutamine amidotransferase
MCTILTSNGKEIPEDYIRSIVESNGDGAGFSFVKDGKLYLEKGFFTFESLRDAYQKAIGYPTIMHARFATSGKKDDENCHPFIINDKLHFCHNGVIHSFSSRITGMSDTFAFCDIILKGIDKDNPKKKWWKNKNLLFWIENAIGKNNKLALLDSDGGIEILNASSGEWIEEGVIWASNSYYKNIKQRSSYYKTSTTDTSSTSNNNNNTNTTKIIADPNNIQTNNESNVLTDRQPTQEEIDQIIKIDNELNQVDDIVDIEYLSQEELEEVDKYLDMLNNQ